MAVSLRRKLYSRGGSFETTIPMQLLFSLDLDKKHDVQFEYDKKTNRWYIGFEEEDHQEKAKGHPSARKRDGDKQR